MKGIIKVLTWLAIIGYAGGYENEQITALQLISLSIKTVIVCCALLYMIDSLRKWHRKKQLHRIETA